MRWKLGHVALLLFQAVWLNVILPGHTRGVVRLPGTDGAGSCHQAASANSCHAGGGSAPTSPDSHDAPKDNAAHCAVCHVAARVTTPPAVDLAPAPLTLLCVRPAPAPEAADSARAFDAYDGRGPPLA